MGYREAHATLRARLEAQRTRLEELDAEAPTRTRRLPRRLRHRVAALRAEAVPTELSAAALARAERAAEDYAETLDEALGLGAELGKSVRPPWPGRRATLRWAACAASSVLLLCLAIHNLGMGDFVLRALGARIAVARHDLTASPLFLEIEQRVYDLEHRQARAEPARRPLPYLSEPPPGSR